jgi:hypothetical protein
MGPLVQRLDKLLSRVVDNFIVEPCGWFESEEAAVVHLEALSLDEWLVDDAAIRASWESRL